MFLTRFATCPRCPPRSRFGPRTRNYIPDDVISFIATRANGGGEERESWGHRVHERKEDREERRAELGGESGGRRGRWRAKERVEHDIYYCHEEI